VPPSSRQKIKLHGKKKYGYREETELELHVKLIRQEAKEKSYCWVAVTERKFDPCSKKV
jgi:hypothetical protein